MKSCPSSCIATRTTFRKFSRLHECLNDEDTTQKNSSKWCGTRSWMELKSFQTPVNLNCKLWPPLVILVLSKKRFLRALGTAGGAEIVKCKSAFFLRLSPAVLLRLQHKGWKLWNLHKCCFFMNSVHRNLLADKKACTLRKLFLMLQNF